MAKLKIEIEIKKILQTKKEKLIFKPVKAVISWPPLIEPVEKKVPTNLFILHQSNS